jgi:acetyl-CoA synthetase
VAADWFTVEFKWWVRILRKIAANELDTLGDTATLAEPAVVEDLIENRANK